MKKTITQRFFLSLCLMIVGCLWGSSAWAETGDVFYTLKCVYNSSNTTYTKNDYNVTYKGLSWITPGNQGPDTKNNTDYWRIGGKNITKIDRTITGKSPINSIISKVTLAHNGIAKNYAKVNSVSLTIASDAGFTNILDEVNLTPTIEKGVAGEIDFTPSSGVWPTGSYYKLTINLTVGNSNDGLDITSLTFYEGEEAVTSPTLIVPSNPISFDEVESGDSDAQTFTFSGKNLTANAELTIEGTNAAMFSVSPETVDIDAEGNIANTNVTVTYAPTTKGEHSATLTIKSDETSKTVSLTGTGVGPKPHYTVTWMVNGATYTEGTPSTDVAEGDKVAILPTNPAAIGSKVFMGWTDSAISGTSASAPKVLFTTAENAPSVTSNTTYYAVFASATAGKSTWEEIKTAPEAGKYAILSDSYFMSNTITSKRFKNGSATPQISSTTPATLTTAPTEDCIWEITKPDSYYRIANGGQYAGGTTSKNEGAMLSDASNNLAKWTIEYSGTQFNVVNYGRSLQTSDFANKYLKNNTTSGWACYQSGTGKAPRLFKETTSYTYSGYATTVTGQDAGLAFEQASYTAEVGELITVKATNASGAAITYSVDDETNCLVDKNKGEFMAGAAGTYTITATCPATETHMAGTATCQVIVTMPASNISATTYYKKITSTDELVDGGVYLIVCEDRNEAMGSLNSSSSRGEGKSITINDNTYTGEVNQSGYPYEITISQAKNGNYNLYHASGYFINGQNGNDLVFSTTTGDDGWSIIFDEDGNVEISNSKKAGNYIQRYQWNSYYKNYSSASGGQTPVQLYQKVGEMSIVQATGGITTYVADFAYVMPQHLVGHTVTLAYEKDEILTEKAFRAGDEVPALTPLLIKSTEDFAADETKTYNPAVLNKTVAAYEGDNMLEYQRDASNMTKSKKTNVYYYKLAIKNDVVGFYWGEPEGGAFKMKKPSTAYLTVPKTMPVQGFVLNLEEGEPTGIATVVTDENAPIYNLQGIRMNGKNLPKGIYIQGGKKFMVK